MYDIEINHLATYINKFVNDSNVLWKELNAFTKALDKSAIIAMTNVKGDIQKVNDNFCQISKFKRDDLIGQNHRIINSGYHSKAFFDEMYKSIASGNVWRNEIRNMNRLGEYYWVDTVIVPILGDNNKPCNYIAVRFDITNKKKLEQKLIEKEELSNEINTYKNHIIATLSHDIRSPLKSLEGLLNMDDLEITTPQEWKRYTVDIRKRINQCDGILKDLIDWSLINYNNNNETRQVEIDIKELVKTEVKRQSYDIDKKNISVSINIDSKQKIVAKEIEIVTVLRNLLSNAIKYSFNKGAITFHVFEKDPEHLCVSVIDNGLGMDKDTISKVLAPEKFFSEGTMGERGAGLGLVICRDILKLLNGRLFIESKKNKGTKVCFTLPIKK